MGACRAFYIRLITRNKGEPNAFKYNLGAFLSASRSVLQFAHKEATKKPGGQSMV